MEQLESLIGISLNPIKPQLISESVVIDTSVLRVVTPHLNSLIDKEDLNTINIMNVSFKIKKSKKLSEYLLYLSSYAKLMEDIEKGV